MIIVKNHLGYQVVAMETNKKKLKNALFKIFLH